MKTVEIHMMDSGEIMVGMAPMEPGMEESGEADPMAGKDYLSPANNLNNALDVARDLLTGNTEANIAQAESDMAAGYKGVRGEEEGPPAY